MHQINLFNLYISSQGQWTTGTQLRILTVEILKRDLLTVFDHYKASLNVVDKVTSAFVKSSSDTDDDLDAADDDAASLLDHNWMQADSPRGLDVSHGPSSWMPPDLQYLLNSFHMFGFHMSDTATFVELWPSVEMVKVAAGQFLFKIGDPDCCIFIVKVLKYRVSQKSSD